MGRFKSAAQAAACAAAAVMVLAPAVPAHADRDAQLLLDRAIESIEARDDDGFARAVTAIESSGLWFPSTLTGALAEQNLQHIITVWILVGEPDLDILRMAMDAVSFERDGVRFDDPNDPFGREMLDSVDLDGFAALETIEHRGYATTPAIETALDLLPQDSVDHPDATVYDAAISDLAALIADAPVADPDVTAEPELASEPDLTAEPVVLPTPAADEPLATPDSTTPAEPSNLDLDLDAVANDTAADDLSPADADVATSTVVGTVLETATVSATPPAESLGLRAAIPWIAVGGISVTTLLLGFVALRRSREAAGLVGLANTDGLTGLHNRRKFDSDLDMHRLQRDRPVAMLMIDVDKFKSFNDAHGHAVGDEVLRLVGTTLSNTIRRHDVAYRYGGEEFCALLRGTLPDEAQHIAERIRAAIEAITLPVDATLTASVGLASGPSSVVDDLVTHADAALYSAKANGRNRVECAS